MELLKFVLSLIEAAAFLVVMVIVAIKISKANRFKSSCDTCSHLVRKNRWSFSECRYECDRRIDFNIPPRYCRNYRERD